MLGSFHPVSVLFGVWVVPLCGLVCTYYGFASNFRVKVAPTCTTTRCHNPAIQTITMKKEEKIISSVSDRHLSLMCHRKEAVIWGFGRQVAAICVLMENYTARISKKGSFIPSSLSQDVSLQTIIRPRADLPGKGDSFTVRGRESFFSTASQSTLLSIQAYIQWVPAVLLLGVKRPETESDHFS